MSEPKNPPAGGSYIRLTPDSDPIFVEGTDRVQTAEEKRVIEAHEKKAKKSTTTEGSDKP